jgi:hypothetical protein
MVLCGVNRAKMTLQREPLSSRIDQTTAEHFAVARSGEERAARKREFGGIEGELPQPKEHRSK